MNEKNTINLVIKTVDGMRLVFTEDGVEIASLVMTRETQDEDYARAGLSVVLMKVICKCE